MRLQQPRYKVDIAKIKAPAICALLRGMRGYLSGIWCTVPTRPKLVSSLRLSSLAALTVPKARGSGGGIIKYSASGKERRKPFADYLMKETGCCLAILITIQRLKIAVSIPIIKYLGCAITPKSFTMSIHRSPFCPPRLC